MAEQESTPAVVTQQETTPASEPAAEPLTPGKADINQQATTATPTTKPAKNPKRVAAGKAAAEKTRQAREAQKKAAPEAAVIIANHKTKQATRPEVAQAPPHPPDESPSRSSLDTTQWLVVASIVVSLFGLYYKRDELKSVLTKKIPALVPAPHTAQRNGLRKMD